MNGLEAIKAINEGYRFRKHLELNKAVNGKPDRDASKPDRDASKAAKVHAAHSAARHGR